MTRPNWRKRAALLQLQVDELTGDAVTANMLAEAAQQRVSKIANELAAVRSSVPLDAEVWKERALRAERELAAYRAETDDLRGLLAKAMADADVAERWLVLVERLASGRNVQP